MPLCLYTKVSTSIYNQYTAKICLLHSHTCARAQERKSTSQMFEMTPNSGEYPRREKHEYKIEYWPLEHVVTFALRQNFNPETCVSSFPLIISLRYFELAM